MGDYTELLLKVELVDGPHISVIQGLLDKAPPEVLPDHPFFSTSRFRFALRGGSAYHITFTSNIVPKDYGERTWQLLVNSSLKNYDSEFEKFLSWVAPYGYLTDHLPVGWIIRTEAEEEELIYIYDGEARTKTRVLDGN